MFNAFLNLICGLILVIFAAILFGGVARSCIQYWWQQREESLKRLSGLEEEVSKMFN